MYVTSTTQSSAPTPPLPPPPPSLTETSQWRSPKKLQSHCLPVETTITEQIERECRWLLSDEYVLCCFSHEVPAELQDGPQCGIVAARMAARTLLQDKPEIPSVEEILHRAIDMNFSNHGEMFSASNLSLLCNDVFGKFGCETNVENFRDFTSNFSRLQEFLLKDNGLILVPYDADSDQRPGLRNGHKAHWAVLSGLAFKLPKDFLCITEGLLLLDEPNLKVFKADKSSLKILSELSCRKLTQFYFVARQSKSRRLFLFAHESLSESNDNLIEFSMGPKRPQEMVFVLPPGGVKEGLCGKCVTLRRKDVAQEDTLK